jgi:hypothetical protein
MICEMPDSYEHHYHKGWESGAAKKCHISHEPVPATLEARKQQLKDFAGVVEGQTPYMFIEKPAGRVFSVPKGARRKK